MKFESLLKHDAHPLKELSSAESRLLEVLSITPDAATEPKSRIRVICGIAFTLAIAGSFASQTLRVKADPIGTFAPSEVTSGYLVAFTEQVSEAEARDVARQSGLKGRQWIGALKTLAVTTGADGMNTFAASALVKRPGVRFIEPNPPVFAADLPNDTSYGSQWAPEQIGAEQAWDTTTGSAAVVVAVLDSGLNLAHTDFAGKTVDGWDFYNDDADPSDDNGHGTHVAGIVGAATNNALGVASIGRNTSIMPVKVLSRYAGGNHGITASGVVWAVDNGAHVINLSLGSVASSATLESALEYAIAHGVLVVAAAGNGNTSTPFYPATYPAALAVGGTDSQDARYSQSNFGSWLDLMAPAVSVYSTNWGASSYNTRTGTSQAAPHVAGVAALMLSVNADLTQQELRDLLESTAVDLGDAGFDDYFAHGRVDADAAVSAASGAPTATGVPPSPTAEPTAEPTPTNTPPAAGPVISNISASPVRNYSADINWVTDIGATSQVEWGRTTSYGNLTALDTDQDTTHLVLLTGLTRRTTYHYRVRSIANGIEAISTDLTFRTN